MLEAFLGAGIYCAAEHMAVSLHFAQQFSLSVGSCYRFTLEMALLIALSLGVSYTPSNSLTECLVRCFNCCVLVHTVMVETGKLSHLGEANV